MNSRFAVFVSIVQLILFAGHLLIYETWSFFAPLASPAGIAVVRFAFFFLSISFVAASLLAARYYNRFVRLFYSAAAVWLGTLNFLFMAAVLCWVLYAGFSLARIQVSRSTLVFILFACAILISVYGLANAYSVRVNRITVKLAGLPASWRGRVAALVSDTHLGHVRGYRFISRIVAMVRQLQPDIVFIAGDLFDGTKVEPRHLAAPWKNISPPLGTFFITGNHEEFSHPNQYVQALTQCGIRALVNEKATVDGVTVVGVTYSTLTHPERLQSVLCDAGLPLGTASILLAHGPHQLDIAEKMGVSLQLSGHTHKGQVFPFTWITSRIFRQYTYGLNRHGALTVYTSSGAGTWGPPMRVGSTPEIVLIRFE